jgi:glutamate-ammonia-ligase adenylyltransferase
VNRATRLLELARSIDPKRADDLAADLGATPERATLVLLGTAFPPLTPTRAYQIDALVRATRDGLHAHRPRRDLFADARRALSTPTNQPFPQNLRRFVWVERARIALRELLPAELGGASLEVTARELSALAEVAIELALEEAQTRVSDAYGAPRKADGSLSTACVLGMGKLGGDELNAGSDIDLIFVYDSDEPVEGKLSLHEYWSRVVRRAVSTLDTPSEDGLIWRVDLRLRPEGASGPIVNSVAATERYYETWGRLWERAALLRARPIAGDPVQGELLLREVITPFVYRHHVDPGVVSTLFDMVERSRVELSNDPTRDLKLCRGGIREAEFFVQALQLIWGGRDPSLRVQGTLKALARLGSRGLVSAQEARSLNEGYAFLRRLEHRIQWMSGLQTHLLPNTAAEQARLGRTLGHADERPLLAELSRIRARIQELFDAVQPGRTLSAGRTRHAALLASLDDRERTEQESERLFGSPEFADDLLALARRPDGLLGELTRERHPALGRDVLEALASCADPEQALRYLRTFFGRFFSPAAYVNALSGDEQVVQRFINVLGSSRIVGDAVVARPELADVILFGEAKVSHPGAAVELELDVQHGSLSANASEEDRRERFVTALRVAKRRLTVEVAVADLAGSLSTREITRLLADLADEVVQHVTARVLAGRLGLAVIALGKLGGRDLGYGSDLDVIFVYDPQHATTREDAPSYFAGLAQQVIRLLAEPNAAGPGYELDMRLRPSGSQGMLVTSIGAFARYHRVDAPEAESDGSAERATSAPWERQALLRARFCAGDARLGQRVLEIAEKAAYTGGAPPVAEFWRIRQRMQSELGREAPTRYDLKTGYGGLVDVEFCVQWLQMQHGADLRIRTADTPNALEALYAAGYLKRNDFYALREGYRFLRRLEQRIQVLTGKSSSIVDSGARGFTELSRRMGLQDEPESPAAERLMSHYAAVTSRVREAFCAALGMDPAG